jgi:hypothetical protein
VILVTINPGLEIVGLLPTGRVGDAYSYTLSVRGGVSPYTMAVTSTLPDGLTATDNGDGTLTIAGTPSVEFAGTVTVLARDGVLRSVSRPLGLAILTESGGDPCAGVEELPEVKIAWTYDTCAGANQWYSVVVLQSDPDPTPEDIINGLVVDALPAGYLMDMPDPSSPETVAETGPIFKYCDSSTATVPVVYVGEYSC